MQVHIFLPTKRLILLSFFFFFFIPANMSFYCKVLCCKVLPQPIISVIRCYMWFWSSGRWWERKRRTWCPSWNNWHKNKSRGTGNKVSCLFFFVLFLIRSKLQRKSLNEHISTLENCLSFPLSNFPRCQNSFAGLSFDSMKRKRNSIFKEKKRRKMNNNKLTAFKISLPDFIQHDSKISICLMMFTVSKIF